MDKVVIVLTGIVVVAAVAALFSFVMSWPIYMLWNHCLVGAIDGIKEITWLQAWGLTMLFSFLFKTNIKKGE